MQWTGIISWVVINKHWGDLHEFLRTHLNLQDMRQINVDGVWEPADRPMIEDIICCRSSHDPRMLFYLRAAGLDITEINGRPPKVWKLGVGQKMGVAGGSSGKLSKKKK